MKRRFKLTPPDPKEKELHASVAHMLDWMLLPPALYTTFPAGGYLLSPAAAGQLQRKGLKPGMPDILVFGGSGTCIGIELKVGKNRLSNLQKEMFDKLERAGIACHVCRCLEDVVYALRVNGFPVRPGIATKEPSHEIIPGVRDLDRKSVV